MNRSTRLRLGRARRNVPALPPDLSAVTGQERLIWAIRAVGLKALVERSRAGQDAISWAKPTESVSEPEPREPDPQVSSPSPSPESQQPRLPAYVPPPLTPYMTQYCRWRVRGPNESYDDDPPSEEDEWDEDNGLIYGDE